MSENKRLLAVSGPWVAETHVCKDETGDGLAVITVIPETERNGFNTPTRGIVAWVHSGIGACDTDDAALATARLISASPDLLAALKVFLGHDDRFQVAVSGNPHAVDRMLDAAHAAVAKAEGTRR